MQAYLTDQLADMQDLLTGLCLSPCLSISLSSARAGARARALSLYTHTHNAHDMHCSLVSVFPPLTHSLSLTVTLSHSLSLTLAERSTAMLGAVIKERLKNGRNSEMSAL
jgi:hypothetical protein